VGGGLVVVVVGRGAVVVVVGATVVDVGGTVVDVVGGRLVVVVVVPGFVVVGLGEADVVGGEVETGLLPAGVVVLGAVVADPVGSDAVGSAAGDGESPAILGAAVVVGAPARAGTDGADGPAEATDEAACCGRVVVGASHVVGAISIAVVMPMAVAPAAIDPAESASAP
jgi:hypothetical protein